MSEPLILNVTQAAKLLGVSRWTMNKMCRLFEVRWIPRGKIGRRIARAELDRWIEANQVGSDAELRKAKDGRRS